MYAIYDELRKERGVRNADVAKATGISPSVFTDWKHGRIKNLASDKLALIADYFGVTVDRLMTGEDPKVYAEVIDRDHLQIENEKRIRYYATVLSALSDSDRAMIEELIARMNHGKGED